jgi:hypothetical protein
MSKSILVEGLPASGKTVSLRNLNPSETFWINADGKCGAWKGFDEQYNKANKNYAKTANLTQILELMKIINEQQKQIKFIVLDTLNSATLNKEMTDKTQSYTKWSDIGQFGYDIVTAANNMRDDLIVILVGHTCVNDEGFENLVTNGRKLEKIQLPAYISVVLLCRHEEGQYKYILRGDNCSARIPFGYFEDVNEIDNDIMLVLDELGWIKKNNKNKEVK